MTAAPAWAGSRHRLFVHFHPGQSPPTKCDAPAERALVLAARDDVVLVPSPVDPEYLDYLAEVGIGPGAGNVIVAGAGHGMAEDATLLHRIGVRVRYPLSLHPLAAAAESFRLAEALERTLGRPVTVFGETPGVAHAVAQKHLLRARAIALGIPVAEGEVAELAYAGGRRRRDLEPVRRAIERQLARTGRVMVRGAIGSCGSASFVVGGGGDDTDGVLRHLALRADNRVYVVEAMVEATVSPTVRMSADPLTGQVSCLGVCDRRWGRRFSRIGYQLPGAARTEPSMREWAGIFVRDLHRDGFAGSAGLDFVEYRDPATGEPRSFLADVNPGEGEASYPLAVRARLGMEAFVSGTAATPATSFAGLRRMLGRLLYTPGRSAGVVPLAPALLAEGRCALVAVAGTRLHAAELFRKAQAVAGGGAGG